LEHDLIQSDLQLFRDEHGEGSVGALAHFDGRHDQGNPPIAANPDEGIRSKCRRGGRGRRAGFAGGSPAATAAQQQSATDRGAHSQKVATGYGRHGYTPFPAAIAGWAACLIAPRIRREVPQRQRFPDMALSISSSVVLPFADSNAVADMI